MGYEKSAILSEYTPQPEYSDTAWDIEQHKNVRLF